MYLFSRLFLFTYCYWCRVVFYGRKPHANKCACLIHFSTFIWYLLILVIRKIWQLHVMTPSSRVIGSREMLFGIFALTVGVYRLSRCVKKLIINNWQKKKYAANGRRIDGWCGDRYLWKSALLMGTLQALVRASYIRILQVLTAHYDGKNKK